MRENYAPINAFVIGKGMKFNSIVSLLSTVSNRSNKWYKFCSEIIHNADPLYEYKVCLSEKTSFDYPLNCWVQVKNENGNVDYLEVNGDLIYDYIRWENNFWEMEIKFHMRHYSGDDSIETFIDHVSVKKMEEY